MRDDSAGPLPVPALPPGEDGPLPLPPWPSDDPAYGRVVLRLPDASDAAMVGDLSTDPYVPLIGTLPARADHAQALEWLDRQVGRHREGAGFSFTIVLAATGHPVGHCGLFLTQWRHGRGTVGYGVAPQSRGHGYAQEALVALTHFAWSLPRLYRLEAYVEPWNIASARTALAAGYVHEGLLRSHQTIDGRRRDMDLYAAIRDPSMLPR